MTIHKAATFVEAYRAKARSRDINELSGRTGRPDLTEFVAEQMVARLPLTPATVLVDVGCGDGQFLLRSALKGVDGFRGRLIGLLPTEEEVSRVREHLLRHPRNAGYLFCIERGLAERTPLPAGYADLLVCNGVLIVLQDRATVSRALAEFARVTRPGGLVFIGELPDADEMAGRDYGDSISSWLRWVWKHQGPKACWVRALQVARAFASREPFVVAPKRIFHLPPEEFMGMLRDHGLEPLEHVRHRELDAQGRVRESATRWNYLARRPGPWHAGA